MLPQQSLRALDGLCVATTFATIGTTSLTRTATIIRSFGRWSPNTMTRFCNLQTAIPSQTHRSPKVSGLFVGVLICFCWLLCERSLIKCSIDRCHSDIWTISRRAPNLPSCFEGGDCVRRFHATSELEGTLIFSNRNRNTTTPRLHSHSHSHS